MMEYIYGIDANDNIVDSGVKLISSELKRLETESRTTYIISTTDIAELGGHTDVIDEYGCYVYKVTNKTTSSWTPNDLLDDDDEIIATYEARNINIGNVVAKTEVERVTDLKPAYKTHISQMAFNERINILDNYKLANANLGVYDVIQNHTLEATNAYIDLTFIDSIYGNATKTNPVDTDDFLLVFNKNGGQASQCIITSVKKTNDTALIGGETTVRFNLSVTGTPNGDEVIDIQLASATSVYDSSGVALRKMSADYRQTIQAYRDEYYRLAVLVDGTSTIAGLNDVRDNQKNFPTTIQQDPGNPVDSTGLVRLNAQ